MSAAGQSPARVSAGWHRRVTAQRVTPLRVAHSEWIKLRSLRSSWIMLLVGFALMVGLGLLTAAVTVSQWPHLPAAWPGRSRW